MIDLLSKGAIKGIYEGVACLGLKGVILETNSNHRKMARSKPPKIIFLGVSD